VIDAMEAVIDWHERGLVPIGPQLARDPRCNLVLGDFFAMAAPTGPGFDPLVPQRKFHAVLLDIDHTPRKLLRAENAALYGPAGLAHLASLLLPGGVFALWSDDPPDPDFERALQGVFETVHAHVVTFPNPLTESESSNTVYVAVRKRQV
jgi:spermidine synthase